MEISRALEIMGYKSILDLKEAGAKGLRKQFVYLVKGQHPDDAGRDSGRALALSNRLIEINEAYEVLKKTTKLPVFNANNIKVDIKIIDIEELCKLYTGEKDTIQCSDGTHINKVTLRQKNVMVQINIKALINGLHQNKVVYLPWNIMDRYEINIESKECNPLKETEISIQIGDVVRTIYTKATSVKIPIVYKSVNINVGIERVMCSG